MLVLKRNVDQSIFIGPDIRVTIVDAGRGWVKIGIEAPNDVRILRDNVVDPETVMRWAENMAKKGVK